MKRIEVKPSKMSRPKADKFISVDQVAELLALSRKTILAGKCGTDELVRVELGTKVVFSKNDVEAWMKRRLEAARQEREQQATKAGQTNVVPIERPLKRNELREIVEFHRVK